MSARFQPTLASLRAHPLPRWYDEAKLGIFIHWTPASVPGFASRARSIDSQLARDNMHLSNPYAEWYQAALCFPESEAARHHRERHGNRPYDDFAKNFAHTVETRWDPEDWAQPFAQAGARYVVLVTKHHDGFCLWPSRVPNPNKCGWHTRRDCVVELGAAVRRRGLRFGVYYSGGLDWSFGGLPMRSLADLFAAVPSGAYPAYADAHFHELIERVAPDVLWNDIAWPGDRAALLRLVADYYNQLPEGLINDRWLVAKPFARLLRFGPLNRWASRRIQRAFATGGLRDLPKPPVFDVRTPEYAVFPDTRPEKWECVRGMDKSFGYNRASLPGDFLSREELIHSLVDIASKNGNLLLNVGPRGEDAQIPEPQLDRLAWLGSFTQRYGEALYGTKPWTRAEGTTTEGVRVRFSARGDTVYAFLLATAPGASVELLGVRAESAVLMGGPVLACTTTERGTRVALPALPEEPAHAIALTGAA